MQATGLKLTVEGGIDDFLGVTIDRKDDGSFHLTQRRLIDDILKELRLDSDNVNTKTTPAAVSTVLKRHSTSESFDGSFNYRSVIGKLNYLEKCTRCDCSYAVHQAARFSADPKKEHGKALMWLGRYLAGTRDKGMIYRPSNDKSFDVYSDADFAGNWDPEGANNDKDTARSRTAFIIMYAGCPIVWGSKLQTLIALSTCESEYYSLSTATRDVIPIMELAKEMQQHGFDIGSTVPRVHCKVFEDNSGALEIATVHKVRPRTKHMNVQYHHFRHYVDNGEMSIHAIDTENQPADMLSKSVPLQLLIRHRRKIMGW